MEKVALVSNGLVGLALMITGAIYGVLGMAACGAVVMLFVGIAGLFYFRRGAEEQEP